MISFILKLLVIIYLFYTIKYIHSMLQYNEKATILNINEPTKDKISVDIKDKCPLIITLNEGERLPINLSYLQTLTPGYIINDNEKLISLDELSTSPTYTIERNKKIVMDMDLKSYISQQEIFEDHIHCNKRVLLSLYKGNLTSQLKKNYNELLLIQPLSGNLTVYLFNPKHEKDIKGLEPNTIKKWGIKVTVTNENIIYVPPEWYYFYESKDESTVIYTEIDSYFSVLFNQLRKK